MSSYLERTVYLDRFGWDSIGIVREGGGVLFAQKNTHDPNGPMRMEVACASCGNVFAPRVLRRERNQLLLQCTKCVAAPTWMEMETFREWGLHRLAKM